MNCFVSTSLVHTVSNFGIHMYDSQKLTTSFTYPNTSDQWQWDFDMYGPETSYYTHT